MVSTSLPRPTFLYIWLFYVLTASQEWDLNFASHVYTWRIYSACDLSIYSASMPNNLPWVIMTGQMYSDLFKLWNFS